MKNSINDWEDFDEESQALLRDISTTQQILNFADRSTTSFENRVLKSNSPDFRSKFHDFNNTPLGYSYLTDDPISTFPSTGMDANGKKGYEYRARVLPCENGSQVLGSYNANKREPQSLFLFYEKPNAEKSNFGGDFYIAKMGDYFVDLFKRFPNPLPSSINGKPFKKIKSMKDEAGFLCQLAYTYENDKIDPTLVYQALMREYQFYTGDKRFEEILGSVSSIPADALSWCAEKLEGFKPQEINYNPEAKGYAPLLPIIAGKIVVNKAAAFFEDLGENPFLQGVEQVFSKVWSMVLQAAGKVKEASIDHLPNAFKRVITKITHLISELKAFVADIKSQIKDLAQQGEDALKLLNAFICGANNGLICLLQCILYILGFLLQPTTTFSYKQYLERRDLVEKAEDVIDWITENGTVFLKAIKDLISQTDASKDFNGILDKMKYYFKDVSRYTIAFYLGLFAFELLTNLMLFIFTEGVGNLAKGVTYLEKAKSLLTTILKESISVVTMGITDLLAFLTKFLARFTKACANGFKGFIKFIEELLQGAKNGAKAEDLAEEAQDIEEVIIKGKKVAEGADASGYRKLSKAYDDIGKLKYIKRFENEIRTLEYEAAKIFDDKGNELSGLITQKKLDSVEFSFEEINNAEKIAGKGNLVITHNHPKNSSISYVDIEMFIASDLKELRAVTKEQKVFCLQKKGKLPSWDDYKSVVKTNALRKHNQKNVQLVNTMRKITNKESQSFINANNRLKQLYTDELLYQLRDVIKYTRYQ